MSRSYKHNPVLKEGYGSKHKRELKRYANRKVRRKLNNPENEEVGNGRHYKKHFESWEIDDYKIMISMEQAIDEYRIRSTVEGYLSRGYDLDLAQRVVESFLKMYPTVEDYINHWWRARYKSK